MSSCQHVDFRAFADVVRLASDEQPDEVVAFRLTLRVECTVCGQAFGFRTGGVVGDLADRPAVSPDALELRVPLIAPAELELLGPLAAMRAGDGLTGYGLRLGLATRFDPSETEWE